MSRLTVLLVDDDDQVRALLREVLEMDGHTVLEASDGTAALAIATTPGERFGSSSPISICPG